MPTTKEDFDAVMAYASDTVGGGFKPNPDDVLPDGRSAHDVVLKVLSEILKGGLKVDEPGFTVVGHLADTWADGSLVDPDDWVTDNDTFGDILGDYFADAYPDGVEAGRDAPLVMHALADMASHPNRDIDPSDRLGDGRRLRPLVLELFPALDADAGADAVILDTLSSLSGTWERFPRAEIPQGGACEHGTVAENVQAWVTAQRAPRP